MNANQIAKYFIFFLVIYNTLLGFSTTSEQHADIFMEPTIMTLSLLSRVLIVI